MKKSIFLSTAAIAALSLALVSTGCKKDPVDTTKPTIKLIAPEDNAKLLIGDEHGVHFDMELEDNDMVASYKIDVHNNFDGHSHETKSLRHEGEKPFSFQKEYTVNQRNAKIHHHDIKIPADAAEGKYHLVVYCADRAGNQSMVARDVELSHDAEGGHHHHHH